MTKTFRKSLAVVVAIAMCLTAVVGALTVSATGTNTITVNNATANAGDTSVNVTINIASEGFAAMLFTVTYDTALGTPTPSVDTASNAKVTVNSATAGTLVCLLENNSDSAVANVTAVTVTLAFAGSAYAAGTYNVSVSNVSAANADEATITFDTPANGTVTVAAAHTHTADTTWHTDATNHWHECTAGDGYVMDQAAHTFGALTYSVVDGVCYTKRACTVCGYEETVASVTNPKLSHSLSLESDLSINYKIATSLLTSYTNVYASFVKTGYSNDGTTTTVTTSTISGTNTAFSFAGVSAKQMNNNIACRIYGTDTNGNVVLLANEDAYSVLTYITTAYNYYASATAGTKNAAFRTLLVDLANYGAAAQTYFVYNTANLANANIPQTYASTPASSFVSSLAESGTIAFKRSLNLANKVTTNLKVSKSAVSSYGTNLSVVVTYKSTTGADQTYTVNYADFDSTTDTSYYIIPFDKMPAAGMSNTFTATLYNGTTSLGVCTYSVETYAAQVAAAAQTNSSYASLATLTSMLITYGKAANSYFNFS